MVIHGRVKDGVIILEDAIRLPEGLRVTVDVPPEAAAERQVDHSTFMQRLRRRQEARGMRGMTADEVADYLRQERDAWGD